MANFCKRGILRQSLGCASIIIAMMASANVARSDAAGEGPLTVILDQAKLVKLPDRAATIVVGNPLIADVSIQAGGMVVITGKGYGLTNMVALDRSGATLMEKAVLVAPPVAETVVVYRGVDKETYSCTPTCSPRIALGDAKDFFAGALTQTTVRNQQAQAATQSR